MLPFRDIVGEVPEKPGFCIPSPSFGFFFKLERSGDLVTDEPIVEPFVDPIVVDVVFIDAILPFEAYGFPLASVIEMWPPKTTHIARRRMHPHPLIAYRSSRAPEILDFRKWCLLMERMPLSDRRPLASQTAYRTVPSRTRRHSVLWRVSEKWNTSDVIITCCNHN